MKVASRRKARELALKVLYQTEIGKQTPILALQDALEEHELALPLKEFARQLVLGVVEHKASIDPRLSGLIPDFDYSRLAAVDRNVMRIAMYEFLYLPAIPPAVTINEAVELAKKYSTEDSGRFVNGVLGKALQLTAKKNWDPKTAPAEFPEPEFEGAEEVLEEEVEVPEVEEVDLDADSDEAKKVARIGGWTLRSDSTA